MRSVDNLTNFVSRLSWNLGATNSWNPLGLSRPVMGLLYLLPLCVAEGASGVWWISGIKWQTTFQRKTALLIWLESVSVYLNKNTITKGAWKPWYFQTRLRNVRPRNRGSVPGRFKEYSLLDNPGRHWGSPSLLASGYGEHFHWG